MSTPKSHRRKRIPSAVAPYSAPSKAGGSRFFVRNNILLPSFDRPTSSDSSRRLAICDPIKDANDVFHDAQSDFEDPKLDLGRLVLGQAVVVIPAPKRHRYTPCTTSRCHVSLPDSIVIGIRRVFFGAYGIFLDETGSLDEEVATNSEQWGHYGQLESFYCDRLESYFNNIRRRLAKANRRKESEKSSRQSDDFAKKDDDKENTDKNEEAGSEHDGLSSDDKDESEDEEE